MDAGEIISIIHALVLDVFLFKLAGIGIDLALLHAGYIGVDEDE